MVEILIIFLKNNDLSFKKNKNILARAEIIGSLGSILLIWGLTVFLCYEAVKRLLDPPIINGKVMLFVSLCSFVFNFLNSIILNTNIFGIL